jgi:O-acetyl-ADP-ribose deacetylase (regulator of RNase III)
MQDRLQQYLRDTGNRHIERGQIVQMPPSGSPYIAVLHAVAVDGLYESSSEVISQIVEHCLSLAAQLGARNVALPLLATGYGHLPVTGFMAGLRSIMGREFPPLDRVVLCIRSKYDLLQIRDTLPGISII